MRAENVAYVDHSRAAVAARSPVAPRRERSKLAFVIGVVLLISIVAYAWQRSTDMRRANQLTTRTEERAAQAASPRPGLLVEQVASAGTSSAFKCEGKKFCGQMTSCEEAKFYLKNCPGVEIDGDGDGVPCEKQWCK